MRAKAPWFWLALAVLMTIPLLLVPGLISAQQPVEQPQQTLSEPAQREPGTAALPAQPSISSKQFLTKLHPDLRELVQTASPVLPAGFDSERQAPIFVEVIASPDAEKVLDDYFVDGKVFARPPLGKGEARMQIFIGQIDPSNLRKLASLGQVKRVLPIVLEQNAEPMPYPPDEERQIPKRGPEDWARLRANAEKLRAGSLPWHKAKAFGDGRAEKPPRDWFEVMPEGPHKAQAAWERGYRGEGVTVAVLDDGIDAAHPDLMGTQKIYSSTVASQYNGWPMVNSPFSLLLYFLDENVGATYVSDGFPSLHYVDTSTAPSLSSCGYGVPGISCFWFTPLLDYGVLGLEHRYVISNTMTKSGVVHVGTHPDNDLRDFIWGEKAAVLVTDPNTAGVYDTVYVDLDADWDFRDEKPLTRADPTDPSTTNNMVAYRDMNGDGLADISGGMLYFIANGEDVIPASDWMWGASCAEGEEFMCPGNGDLVAFSGGTFDQPYSHGTQCASNVVGQGRTNGLLPAFSDLPDDGKPAGAVFGMAPEAKVVNVSDIYWNSSSSIIDAYIFAAVGYDGIDQTGYSMLDDSTGHTDTDAIQITSNSYGDSSVDNDGWDYEGQVVSQLQRWWAPHLQFLFSTGNGAPAYGTVAPPSPAMGIGVGASTEFGSTGWDSITETTQIMFNDVTPFSNRGPGARGTNGVDVVAGGAFAAGAEELNYYSISNWAELNGNLSWVSWGGTSRSSPVAMGVLALLYQAYYEANGTWPTYDQAKALLMSTATDLNYDIFTQGAGSVNADRGTAVAGGHYGLYVESSAPTWQPGDYRGVDYPGFAHVAYPGDTFTKTFTISNTGAQTITASIDDAELRLIDSVAFDFTVTADMVAAESAYGSENRDNFFKAFNHFIPITATAAKVAQNADWDNITIPPDADLMIVRQTFPYDQFDVDGDYSWDNRFYLTVYNWQDVDGDGLVWDDQDGNSVVNFINSGLVSQVDGGQELDWGDSRTELDRWEFGRFSYHRPGSNRNEMWVHDPLDRMIDGLFIGLRHHPSSVYTGTTTLSYRVDFYKQEDVAWLTESASDLEVPPGASATFVATASVPTDTPAGIYEAAIRVQDPGLRPSYDGHTSVIPVVLNVAAPFTDGMQLGGMEAYTYDQERPYNNGVVRGLFDWTWRAESGDWRFFFSDVPDGTYPPDTQVLVRDEWNDAAPHTDLDNIVFGPTSTPLGSGWYDAPEPDFYGPYVLDTVGKSPNTYAGGGTWLFDTSSGANEDWVAAPITGGLHAFLQHNVLFEGLDFDVVFTKTVGTLQSAPDFLAIETGANSGQVGEVSLESSLPLNGLIADGFGLGGPEYFLDEPIDFVGSNTIEWIHEFTVTHGAKIELWTSSSDISDIDLYLFYCGPTGEDCDQRGASTTGTADEYVQVLMPEDGVWLVGINNWSGPAGHFDLTKLVIQGFDLSISGLPEGAIAANTPVSFTVSFDRDTMVPGETYEGLVLVGPPEAPALVEVPVIINRRAESRIDLVEGWNLASSPIIPVSTSTPDVLLPIEGSYDRVFAHDGCDPEDPWKLYDPEVPDFVNDLDGIDESMGVWIKMNTEDTLVVTGNEPTTTDIPLCAGWNLIGYPATASRPVTEVLASIDGQYERVYAFDASDTADPWKLYDPNVPGFVNDLIEFRPKLGYWILATEETTLTVEN